MALGKNIKGITIEFRGDTKQLDRALKEVKAEAKGIDKELRDVNKLLKMNPHNTELLAQKQTLLRTKIDQTKQELKALEATQKKLDDDPAVDKTSRDYMELRREIIRTEQTLNKLEKEERELGVATTQTTEKMKRQQRESTRVKKGMGGIKRALVGMAGYAAAAFSIGAIVQFGKETLEASAAQTEAETKLETIMKKRMKSTDAQIKKIKELTAAEQKNGVIGDEVQLAGAQQLATFMKQEKSLSTLIPAMNDLAAQQKGVNATSGDMVSIANLMGKAMNGNVGALKRVGITFTDAQAEVLKYGTEEEKAAMLAQVITDNVGDMNTKLAETDAGKIQQAKNAFGDMKEEIGAKLLPVLAQLAEKLLPIIDAISKFLEDAGNPDTEIGATFQDLGDFVTQCGMVLQQFNGTLGGTKGGINGLKIALTLLKIPIAVVTAGMAGFMGVVKFCQGVVSGMVNTVKTFGQGFKELGIMVKNAVITVVSFIGRMKAQVIGAVSTIKNSFSGILEKITSPFETAYKTIKGIIEKLKNLFPLSVGKVFSDIKLPHFNITGGKAPWGLGGKGVKPTIGIDWYANGGIFNNPSIIGVGERGAEAVIPLNTLWAKMDAIADAGNGTTINVYGSPGMNVKELADEVEKVIIQNNNRRRQAWE